jgi:hypothetical protein
MLNKLVLDIDLVKLMTKEQSLEDNIKDQGHSKINHF